MSTRKRRRRRRQVKPAVMAESVGDRVQKQREELFKVMGIVECCRYASDSRLVSASGGPDIAAALEAAYESLDRAAGELGMVVDDDRERRQRGDADN